MVILTLLLSLKRARASFQEALEMLATGQVIFHKHKLATKITIQPNEVHNEAACPTIKGSTSKSFVAGQPEVMGRRELLRAGRDSL